MWIVLSLVALACAQSTSSPVESTLASETIFPFSVQSKGINFNDWISLLTLALAPLAVHLIAGVPSRVYLSDTPVRWHDEIGFYNPTTILWRYFAILDRRVRAKAWSAADMAASNAYFWTDRGWDGSEEMMGRSRAFCTQIPENRRTTFLSTMTGKTIVVTLQGAQAIYSLVSGAVGSSAFSANISLETIFFPLAVFGLLRLPAAPWLTEDYLYADYHTLKYSVPSESTSGQAPLLPKARTLMSMNLVEPSYSVQACFHPPRSWRGTLVRVAFLLPLTSLLALALAYTIPRGIGGDNEVWWFSVTTLIEDVFYLVFLTATILTYSVYFNLRRSATTIIPCITSMWYKCYTVLMIVLMAVLFIIAALETRKSPCGLYTTLPKDFDTLICQDGFYVSANATLQNPFGLVIRNSSSSDHNTSDVEKIDTILVPFNGFCQGLFEKTNLSHIVPLNGSMSAS